MVSCPTRTQNLELYLIKGARNFNVISVITMLQPHKIWPNTRSQVCPCAFIQILLKLYRNFIHFFWKNSLDPDFLTKFTWSKILHKLTFIPKLEQDLIQIFIWIKWGQSRNKIWINEHGHEFTVHEKLRNFKCVQCGAAFSQKTHLRIHIQNVHEKVKHFVCHLCGKGFADKSRSGIYSCLFFKTIVWLICNWSNF